MFDWDYLWYKLFGPKECARIEAGLSRTCQDIWPYASYRWCVFCKRPGKPPKQPIVLVVWPEGT